MSVTSWLGCRPVAQFGQDRFPWKHWCHGGYVDDDSCFFGEMRCLLTHRQAVTVSVSRLGSQPAGSLPVNLETPTTDDLAPAAVCYCVCWLPSKDIRPTLSWIHSRLKNSANQPRIFYFAKSTYFQMRLSRNALKTCHGNYNYKN